MVVLTAPRLPSSSSVPQMVKKEFPPVEPGDRCPQQGQRRCRGACSLARPTKNTMWGSQGKPRSLQALFVCEEGWERYDHCHIALCVTGRTTGWQKEDVIQNWALSALFFILHHFDWMTWSKLQPSLASFVLIHWSVVIIPLRTVARPNMLFVQHKIKDLINTGERTRF